METNCSECSKEAEDDEISQCPDCQKDGLGPCCIGSLDHVCSSGSDDVEG